jgi:hypothetical protein
VNKIESESYGGRTCYGAPVEQCIVVRGSGSRILLIGDSHALSLVPAFAGFARASGLTLAVSWSPSCPWPRGLVEVPIGSPTDLPQTCLAHQADWYDRLVPRFNPDVIVLAHHAFDDAKGGSDMRASGELIHPGKKGFARRVRAAARDSVKALAVDGRKVVILEPLPVAPAVFNPMTCLSKSKYLDDCRYAASPTSPTEKYYRSLANGSNVYTLDLDRLVCPYFPICDPIVNGVVVKRDQQHITADYSQTLGAAIGRVFRADGIVSR